jgi:type I restriction enzyme S subunit
MKAGWKTVKLGEVCSFERGLTYSKSDEADAPGITVLRANNVDLNSGQLNFEDLRYINSSVAVDERKYLSANSIIVCTASGSRDHLGKTAHISEPPRMTFGGFMGLLRPHGEIDSRFLFYLTRSDLYRGLISSLSAGTNINNLKGSDLLSWEIPLPPLAEQKRIVELLDEAFAGIDEAKANAEAKTLQLESFIPSAWSSLLPSTLSNWPDAKASPDPELPKGWSIKTIEEISEKDGPVRYGILQPGPHIENGVPYVRPTEIVNDLIPEGSLRRTSTKIASMYSRSVLKPNDVILTIVGTIGKVALVPKWLEGGNVTQSSARIRPEATRCSPDYLAAMLRSPILRRQFEHYRMGAAVTRLNIADVKTLRIPLPPLSMQSSIVKNLDSFKAHHAILKDNNDSVYRELASLKSSILAKAFAGNLSV